jgi:hypothetical protein
MRLFWSARLSCVLLPVLLTASPAAAAAAVPHPGAAQGASGFYVQSFMCHACAYPGWQEDVTAALAKSGVQASVTDDVSSHYIGEGYRTLTTLRLRRQRPSPGWVFVSGWC